MCQFLKLYAPQAKQKFSAAQELQLAAASHAVLRVQIQKSPHCTIKMVSCPGAFAHCAPSQRVEEQPPLGSEVKLEKGKTIKTIMAQGERSEPIFWMLFLGK
jgi:hypothetical protein